MVNKNTENPPKPSYLCGNCGSNNWWLRKTNWGKPEWICGTCHPKPQVDEENNKEV